MESFLPARVANHSANGASIIMNNQVAYHYHATVENTAPVLFQFSGADSLLWKW